jgi:hypothetical protein
MLRKSVGSKAVFSSIVPVRNPLPSGLERDEADAEFFERGEDCARRFAAVFGS